MAPFLAIRLREMETLAEITEALHEADAELSNVTARLTQFVNTHPDLRTTPPIFPFGAMRRIPETARDRAEYRELESKRCRLVERRAEILNQYAKLKTEVQNARNSAGV